MQYSSSSSFSRVFFLWLWCCWCTIDPTSTTTLFVAATERAGHIDLFDAETLSYYFEAPKQPYDVVVLYYAQWCQNCRALSPIYIRIAELLKAGQSNLILGYFDCEASYEHALLCEKAGITHYPTIQYISLAPEHHLPGKTLPSHITQFPGNWQIGEAILDWIRTMSFLSQWHRASWGKSLRQVLFSKPSSSSSSSSTSTTSTSTSKELPIGLPVQVANEKQLHVMEQSLESTQTLLTRTSYFVDAMLSPTPCHTGNDNNKEDLFCTTESMTNVSYIDAYAYLHGTQGWSSMTPSAQVIRSCVLEAVLDICQRVQVQIAETWLAQQTPIPQVEYLTQEQLQQFEPETRQMMQEKEPYCLHIEQCILDQLEPIDVCLPNTCPFQDTFKCRYLTACFTETVQQDYAKALEVELSKPKGHLYGQGQQQQQQQQQQKKGEEKSTKRQQKWGLF